MMLRKCLFVILLTLVPLIKSEADSVLDREKRSDRLTAYACEDTTLNITCGPDLYLDVIRANYGRFSITICNVHGNTEWKVDCQAGRTLRAMQTRCSNKNQCIVPVQSSIFGDPCPGTYKYIEVHYACRKEPIAPQKDSTTRRPIPSWTLPTFTTKTLNSTEDLNVTVTEPSIINPEDGGFDPQQVTVKPPSVDPKFVEAISQTSNHHQFFPTFSSTSTSTTKRPPLSIVVNNFTQYCPSDRSRGLAWNWTLAGETAVVQCPQGSSGFAKRSCEAPDDQDQRVHWTPKGPSLAECRSLWLGDLDSKLRSGSLSVTNVSSVMSQNSHKSHIYGGDLVLGARMLKHMAERMHYDLQQTVNLGTRESMVTDLVQNVVKTASNLISDSEQIRQSWGDLSQDELGRAATALLVGLEENAFLLAETVTSEKIIIKPTENILLSIRVMQARNAHKQVFPSIETTETWTTFGDRIELSPEAIIQNGNNGAVRVIFTAFNQLDQLLIPIKGRFGHESTTRRFINSRVIAASLGRGRHIELPKPVKITFRHLNDVDPARVRPECVYWDYVSNAWLDDGCYAIMSNVTHTQCSCNHLTNFALLMSHSNANIAKNEIKMSPSKSDNKNKSSITPHILTIVVSIAALIVVAIIIFFAVIAWKKFKVSSQCRSALQNSGLPCFHKGKELPPDNAGNKGNFYTVTPKLYSNGREGVQQMEQEDVAEARQFFEHMINLQKNNEPQSRIQEKTNNLEQQKKMKQEGLYPKRSNNLRALSPYNHIYMEIDGTEQEQPVYEPLTHSETYLMSGMSDMSEDYVQTTTDVSRQSSNRETRPLIRSISNEPRANLLQTISGVLHSQSVRIAPSGINGMNRAATLHPIRRNTQGGYSARFDMNTLARLNGSAVGPMAVANEMPLQVASVNGNEFVRLNLNGQPEDANATYIASTTSDLGGQPATLMTSAYLRANAMQMQPMVQPVQSMGQPIQAMGQPIQAMAQPVLAQQQQPQFASEI